jgi:hypothetical protein
MKLINTRLTILKVKISVNIYFFLPSKFNYSFSPLSNQKLKNQNNKLLNQNCILKINMKSINWKVEEQKLVFFTLIPNFRSCAFINKLEANSFYFGY